MCLFLFLIKLLLSKVIRAVVIVIKSSELCLIGRALLWVVARSVSGYDGRAIGVVERLVELRLRRTTAVFRPVVMMMVMMVSVLVIGIRLAIVLALFVVRLLLRLVAAHFRVARRLLGFWRRRCCRWLRYGLLDDCAVTRHCWCCAQIGRVYRRGRWERQRLHRFGRWDHWDARLAFQLVYLVKTLGCG